MDKFKAEGTVDDMTNLPELSENSILDNLRERYKKEIIYTYTGTILVAANPYKWIEIYADEYVTKYSKARFGELPPHIFAISEACYYNLRTQDSNQSVVISGESGAGKTESTKLILQYLTAVTSNQAWVEQQIMESNTILEAFGNAKTVKNNNSSRFGKFIQIRFNESYQIQGASIVSYLLEKSRVVFQAPTERNYHCFYQLVFGTSDEDKAKYIIKKPEEYHYLNQSGCTNVEKIDDVKEFEALKMALTVLGIPPEEVDALWRLLSAILHIGNVSFEGDDAVNVTTPDSVKAVSELLELDYNNLLEAFGFRQLIVRGETSKIPLKGDQALANRDAISKALFQRIFDWLLDYINVSIKPKVECERFAGVLDIFGFELFKVNSFEQFCINFCNEKLQQFFTNYIFKLEQAEYEKEGISWDKIEFSDNADCIEMIENKKTGVLALLDEESRMPKGSDKSYLDKMGEKYKANQYFLIPKKRGGAFGINHYAGEVIYEIVGFLDKNKDEASDLMFEVLQSSKIPVVSKLSEPKIIDEPKKGGTQTMKKKATVSGHFKRQLQDLVDALGGTQPQYVRCIKPNSQKQPFLFEEELVLGQLRYSGMLETIRIRKAGYSMRIEFKMFLEKFQCLAPKAEGTDDKAKCVAIMENLKTDKANWQVGHNKVFMRNSVFIPLQDALDKFIKERAVIVAKILKGNFFRAKFKKQRAAVGSIQKNVRMVIAKQKYRRQRTSAVKIQAVVRGWFARDFYRMLKKKKQEEEEERKRKAEEERRRKAEEEAKKMQAAEAEKMRKAEAERQAEEERLRQKKIKEEQEILELTRQAQQVKTQMKDETPAAKPGAAPAPKSSGGSSSGGDSGGADALGDMFSFLDVVDDETIESTNKNSSAFDSMMDDLSSELDGMYNVEADDYRKTISKKKNKKTSELPIGGLGASKGAIKTGSSMGMNEVGKDGNIYDNLQKRSVYKTLRGSPVAMKANPLMKQFEESSKPTEEATYEMIDFAKKYFEEHEKASGTIGTLRKKKKLTHEEMLYYTKNFIPTSMIRFQVADEARREKMITVSVEIFREIFKIIDPNPKKEENLTPMIQNVVKLGIGVPELRDEIFVQLIRQSSEPPKEPKQWDQICLKSWQMLNICLSCFPPSKNLSKYLRTYLRKHTNLDEVEVTKQNDEGMSIDKRKEINKDISKYAKQGLEAFQSTVLNGPRKLPPSSVEIEANKNGRPIICRFYFLDGNVKAIGIHSSSTASQAIKELANRIDLPDTSGWSIYEVYEDRETVVKGNENIADILARWEAEKRTSMIEDKYQTVKKGVAAVKAIGGGDAKFYLKKRLYRTPQKIPTDPVEYHLIYAQAVAAVLRGDFPLTEQASIRLAALKAQIDWGDYDSTSSGRLQDLSQYVPPRFLADRKPDEWRSEINAIHAKLVGKSVLQAKVLYLEAVKQFPMYGATLFPATYKGFWAYSEKLLIAIYVDGIAWVHPKTKNIMKSYPYSRLDTWELDINTVILTFKPGNEAAADELLRYEFSVDSCEELVALIKDYSPTHRTGVTKEEKERKRRQEMDISDDELHKLGSEVEKARKGLLESGLMRIPGPNASGSNTSKLGTLKKLTMGKKTMKTEDKLRKAAGSDYTVADWSFSKARLSFSLLAMDDINEPEVNDTAIKTHTCLLTYAGLVQNGPAFPEDENPRAPNSYLIQDVIRTCLENSKQKDELFVQLVKLTTAHPEPDSKAVLKLWKFLCIACWIFLPSKHILAYLRAHLRSAAYGTSPSLARRKREKDHAKYALKAVQRTTHSGSRKQPPSVEEIIAVTSLKPMFSRFHFMDGQFRALTFDPATTTAEILDMVKEKIGCKNATGFSIFESFGSLERAMTGKEKIADTIFKWDKFAKQTNSDKTLKLVFKRRIYMPPLNEFSNDTERHLVMYQAIHDVANDRYPVTEEEAAYFAGLRAQIELGDTSTYKPDDQVYADNVKKYFPKHFVKVGATNLVCTAHKNMKGKTREECIKLYMERVNSWELYGATIFNVLQSYTSAMPNNLWLAVSHTGVHILNRRSKSPLLSYPYKSIVNYSPSHKNIMLMTESLTRGTKYVFNTSEASQIAHLIKDYTDSIIAARKKEKSEKK